MSRIIVDIRSDISDSAGMTYATKVVQQGRISENNSFCAVTTFKDGVQVHASKNKSSDRLIIIQGVPN